MKTTEYLYELDIASLEKMLYFDALQYKANCAKRLWNKLEAESKTNDSFDLHERKFYVWEAWGHNKKLLREREEHGSL